MSRWSAGASRASLRPRKPIAPQAETRPVGPDYGVQGASHRHGRCAYVRSAEPAPTGKIERPVVPSVSEIADRKSRAASGLSATAAARAESRQHARRETARAPASAWVIQLGAMDDEDKAKSMLEEAKSRSRTRRWLTPRPLPRRSCATGRRCTAPASRASTKRTTLRKPAVILSAAASPASRPAAKDSATARFRRCRCWWTGSRVEYQRCRVKRTSLAWFTRAARYVDPPWSGWSFFIRVRCARRTSSAARPRLKAQDLVGFLFRHRSGVRPTRPAPHPRRA